MTSVYHILAGFGIWGLHLSQSRSKNKLSLVGTVLISITYFALAYFPIQVMNSGLTVSDYITQNPFKTNIYFLTSGELGKPLKNYEQIYRTYDYNKNNSALATYIVDQFVKQQINLAKESENELDYKAIYIFIKQQKKINFSKYKRWS